MIIQRFEQQVEKHLGKLAVETGSGAITYKKLDTFSNRIAGKIKALDQGKVNIGLLMDDALDMIAAILGVLKAGHTYVPMVKDFPAKRLQYIIQHAEIGILITDNKNKEGLLKAVDNKNVRFILVEDAREESGGERLAFQRDICTDSDAYILYTSGSTGFPKGVRQTHRNIVFFIDRYTENLALTCADNFTLFSSFSHDASIMDIYSALLNGAALFPLDLKKEGIFSRLPRWLKDNKISVWHSVPTVYRYFSAGQEGKGHMELPYLRYIVLGGEAVLKSDIEKFYSFSRTCPGRRLYNLYGQTESTYNSGQFYEAGGADFSITLGETVKGTEIFVVDDEGDEVEALEVGEIIIVGGYVSPGYWQDEESSREKFAVDGEEKIYFTGDLGRCLGDGRIEYSGRKDSQVKIRGFRIELGEIENAVLQYDYIGQAAVIPIGGGSRELFLACYFAADRDIDMRGLREYLGERLLDYMIPAYFRQLDRLPATVSGKIDRKALPAPDVSAAEEYIPPAGQLEKKLVEIWSEILHIGQEVIGRRGNFFQLGGHSLRAAVLTAEIHRQLQVKVPLSIVFDRQTVAGLAEYIEGSGQGKYEGITPAEKREYYPLSSAQRQMYVVQQLDTDSTIYNIPYVFVLGEDADGQRLGDTFRQLVQRHEILRTSFRVIGREVVQRVHEPGRPDAVLEYYTAAPGQAEDILKGFSRAFHLSGPHQVRAGLLKAGGHHSQYTLIIEFHHIIADNISLNLLEKEFMDLYNGGELPRLTVHYKDYCQWLGSGPQKEAVKKQEEYWLKTFSGEIPLLELPYDYPRPLGQGFEGRTVLFILEKEVLMPLKKTAAELDATLYMVLLAALGALFSRLGGQADIIIGAPVATRGHSELQHMAGMFVNTIPLRIYPPGQKPFRQLLQEVKQTTLAAFENREYPFDELVEKISGQIRRAPGRNPVFDVMFNLLDERHFKGDTIEVNEQQAHDFLRSGSRFDLSVTAGDRGEKIVFRWEYSTRLFKPETMDRIIGYYKTLLSGIPPHPAERLDDLEIIPEAEKENILRLCSGPERPYEKDKTIHRLFEEQAVKTPDHIALVYENEALSYKELDEQSHRLAHDLHNKKGITPGTVVGVSMDRSLHLPVCILGILKAGGVYLPIDPASPEERIDYMLKDSGAAILLTTGDTGEKFLHPSPFTPLAYIIYTSGTTGRPKGVMISHRGIANLQTLFKEDLGIGPGDRIIQFANISFDAAVWEIFIALLSGAVLHLLKQETIDDYEVFHDYMVRNNITAATLPPPFANHLDVSRLGSLRMLITAGSPANIDFVRKCMGHFEYINGYGPTEVTVCGSLWRLKDGADLDRIPIGRPIVNTTFYILGENMRLQPVGAAGELCISGEGLARGYLNNPELTAERFLTAKTREESRRLYRSYMSYMSHSSNKVYKTGDLARWLPDGNVEFLGRIDQQVKIRGFRIELQEIESRLLKHKMVKEAAVLDREEGGEKYLCAYIVPGGAPIIPGGAPISPGGAPIKELKDYLSRALPSYMIPSYFISIDKIPLTRRGKVDRKALPAPGAAAVGEHAAPRDGTEKKLAGIWSEILNIDGAAIGIESNFFELGGHSLKAAVLLSKIHKELEVKIPLAEVFKNPTLRTLAQCIKHGKAAKYAGIDSLEKKEYYPLSSAQKRLYFLQRVDVNGTAYNMPQVLPVENDAGKDRLESTLKKLIARHESLRTSFIMVEDKAVQRIHDQVSFVIENYDLQSNSRLQMPDIMKEFVRPFDLSKAPLLRWGIIENRGGSRTWLVDIHHIVSDGTSHAILREDFTALYNEEKPGPLRLQYKDFSGWQNRLFAGGVVKIQEEFWLDRCLDRGEIPRLRLPADFKRPEVFTFAGNNYDFMLDRQGAAAFKTLGTANDATLYMNILAVLNTLFYKYTGQTDMIIGSGIAGRPHADLQQIIGMFVNTLAMRNYPAGEKTYTFFLKEVAANSVDAFENQDVQFEELVDKLDLERDPSGNPLFDISMVVQNFRDANAGQDAREDTVKYKNPTAAFDITFFIHEEGDDVFIRLEYYSAIFKEETIKRLAGHFKNVIKAVVKNPSIMLKDIEIISPEEKRLLLYEFNDTAGEYPTDRTIHRLFAEQAAKTPDRIALVDGNKALTYKELDGKANQLARYLYDGKRSGPEGPVGIWTDQSLYRPAAILGALKSGSSYVPIDPSLPPERIKYMINDAGIGTVISGKKYIKTLNRLQWECGGFHSYLCVDSFDIAGEDEAEQNELMDRELWHHVGETAADDIAAGGWVSSFTGEPLSREEMDEYGDNILKKLEPLLHEQMRVLEIGCASGISMYRIAPKVAFYHSTDLSSVIIDRSKKKLKEEGHRNIELSCLAAHEIDRLREKNFDLIIMNSVIQCFHGHNYLAKVIKKAVDLLADKGYLFIGDIMDQQKKDALVRELTAFKRAGSDKHYTTKTDFSSELFVAREYWLDLAAGFKEIENIEFTDKIYTLENELTKFRYDALITVDKKNTAVKPWFKRKYRDDLCTLAVLGTGPLYADPPSNGLAYIVYTSGTTGKPKGVMIRHRSLVNLCSWHNRYYRVTETDRATLYAGFGFDASVWELFPYLIKGSALYIIADSLKLDIDKLNEYYELNHITISFLPTQLCEQFTEKDNLSLRVLLTGGDKLRTFVKRNYELYNNYGPTENTVVATSYLVSAPLDNIPIGRPIANNRVYVLNGESLQLQPVGVVGELCISGEGLARGYLNNPELTAERLYLCRRRLYKTGDFARWLPDGNVEFLGRIDQQVKIRGFRIELQEIEARLLEHGSVKDAAVIDREDAGGEKYLCAYIVAERMAQGAGDAENTREFLSQTLPGYMIPAYFVQLDKLPLTAGGKVDRKKLPEPGITAGGEYAAPGDNVEKALVNIWSDVLALPTHTSIGIHDNFFELGGHSLKATILTSKIHKELQVKVPLAEVFKHQTVRGLAGYIRQARQAAYAAVEPLEKREYYGPSSAQKRLYFLQQMAPGSTGYNIPLVLPLGEGIKISKLESTLKKLVTRHESLRTSFIMLEDKPVQRIHDNVTFEMEYYVLQSNYKPQITNIIEHCVRPFDLSKSPLLRSLVMKHPDGSQTWLVDMHHIISDGTSNTILGEDFKALYDEKKLEPLRLQYKDFSQWQNRLFESGAIKEQEDFWLTLYPDVELIPRLNLPTDYKRPEVFTFVGNSYDFMVDGEELQSFRTLSAANGATLYMNILAILNTLFYKYTGQTDMIIGSGIAGRPHADLQQIIGMFVNTLAMRNYPAGEKTYEFFLKEVAANSVAAFENQDVQFEDLVDKLDLERDPSRNPLFDISMVVQNFRAANAGQAVRGDTVKYKNLTAKFDITFFIHEEGDNVFIRLEYYSAIFKEETIKRLAGHFKNVIKAVVKHPPIKLKNIDILSAQEKRRLLYEFNDTAGEYPQDKTIHRLFEEQVDRAPDSTAVVYENKVLTYKELDGQANRLAHYLYHKKGIEPGVPVGIMMNQSLYRPAAVLGILKSGNAYVPIDPLLPRERVKFMIDDAGIGLVISGKKYIKMLNRLQWECKSFHHYLCVDSVNIYGEDEGEQSELMAPELWRHVGETSVDDITGGGWLSSYTGEPFSRTEMDEYGDNILKKLGPFLHKQMRVLEIGCASGISMFRIAPGVGFYYGTDLSSVIIDKNKKRVKEEGHENIRLACLAAHEIHRLQNDFDLIIMNSVIQCFHGHNYLRKVIKKAVTLLAGKGYLFIGDIMDQGKKDALVGELVSFKHAGKDKNDTTKTDFSSELFIAREYWGDLENEFKEIESIELSDKIYTIENELTKFRYDALLKVNKKGNIKEGKKIKTQEDYRAVSGCDASSLNLPVGSGGPAYIIYTSGTTGGPKGVMVAHRGIANLNTICEDDFTIGPDDHIAQFANISFDASVWETFMALLNGAVLHLLNRQTIDDYGNFHDYLQRGRITVIILPPPYAVHLDFGKSAGLRLLLTGGSPANIDFVKRCKAAASFNYINAYGPTEDSICSTYWQLTKEDDLNTVPIGKPISNTQIYIVNENMSLQPIGAAGELCISGEGLARGYLNNPELTAEKFLTAKTREESRRFNMSYMSHMSYIYKTGDLARWLPEGNVEFLGRIDQQVKIRGFRIELAEIEAHLSKYEPIKEVVVIDREDQESDKYLCAYIVAERMAHGAGGAENIREFLSQTLPDYMIPSYFVQLDDFPLTSSGKLDRKKLPPPGITVNEEYAAPGNNVEKALVKIWHDVLGLPPHISIGIHDNFFELGGHSLKATILTSKIHKKLEVKIPLAEVFKRQTIKGLSSYIQQAGREKYAGIKPVEKREYHAPSSAQKRLYFFQRWNLNSTGYNMPFILPLGKGIDIIKLEAALKELIDRHESLRTSFIMVDEHPVQRIHDNIQVDLDFNDSINGFVRPFDLSRAPLLRSGIMENPDGSRVWLIDMHHIISDGTSHTILTGDFIALYEGRELGPLRLQYKDFSVWQNCLAGNGGIKAQEEYWLQLYADAGEISRLHLPADYKRPEVFTFAGAGYDFILEGEAAAKFKALAAENGGTLYMNILAALDTLFYKYTGQTDIIIGTGIAGRPHADLQKIIGMFVNTLAPRNYPEGEKTYEDFLKEVITNSVKAFENQDVQFEELVDKLELERDTSRNPLFDILMVVQNFSPAEGPGQLERSEYRQPTAKFDMTFFIHESKEEDHIYIRLEYYTGIFNETTIKRLVSHFKKVINTVAENPGITLDGIEILSKAERDQLLYEFNDTAREYPGASTLHELFEEQAEKSPGGIAVIGRSAEGRALSYKELNEKSNRLAHRLRAQGVEPGSIVAIRMERSIEMIIGIMSILKAGGAYLPIDPGYPQERVNYMLADSGAKIVFSEVCKVSGVMGTGPKGRGVLAYVIYTSGTTGRPKGTLTTHSNVIRVVRDSNYIDIGPNDRVLQLSNYAFDGSVFDIYGALLNGAALVMVEKEDVPRVEKLADLIKKEAVTLFFVTTALFNKLVELAIDCFKNIRKVLFGGEQVSVEHTGKALGYMGKDRLIHMYGPTETTVYATYYFINEIDRDCETIPIGRPITNTTAYILDRAKTLVPIGVPGELYIGGDGVARGYLNNPESTAEKFLTAKTREGGRRFYMSPMSYLSYIYKTGDLAKRLFDGHIVFIGRIDHQVKIRGFRIELAEIETQLLKHHRVKEAVVTAGEDRSGDRYLCAYIVPVSRETADTAELKEYLSQTMPNYMIPAFFIEIEKIPLTINGKIDRKKLPAPEQGIVGPGHDYTPPRDELEESLVEIWAEVLGIEKNIIGIDADFFALGGHSLKATVLVSRIHKKLNSDIPLVELFKRPRVRELSRYIKENKGEKKAFVSIEPAEEREYYALSPAQKRLYILQQLAPAGTAYNLPTVVTLEGAIEKEKLERVFLRLIHRHESLRTSFEMKSGQPVRRVHDHVDFAVEYFDLAAKNAKEREENFIHAFDLSHPPLMRVKLIKVENKCYTLMVDMHHIVTDGTSMGIFIKEFTALYAGEEPAPLRIQFKDFAQWQNSFLEKEGEIKKQEAYWLAEFREEIPPLRLPLDYARPTVQSFEGDTAGFELDGKQTALLKTYAAQEGATLFMVLLALYNVLLLKLSGQEDIVVGSPIAGRRHADLEKIIGMFVNTLASRNYPCAGKTFKEFLKEVKEKTLKVYENQDCQFEDLVDKVDPPRDPGRNPLFDVMFALQNVDIPAIEMPGLKIEPYNYEFNIAKFDLTLTGIEAEDHLFFSFEYGTKLFKQETIQRFIVYFKQILSSVLENPGKKVMDIEILPGSEKKQLLLGFNDTETQYPKDKTIHELFAEQAEKNPDGIAVMAQSAESRALSYKELNEKSNLLAGILKVKGVQPDTAVGLMMERSLDMIIGILSILKAGGAYLPIDPGYPRERIEYMLADSSVKVLLTTGNLIEKIRIADCRLTIIDCQRKIEKVPVPPAAGETPAARSLHLQLAYVLYTSGSTGGPKGVMVEHGSVIRLVKNTDYIHFGKDDRILQTGALEFDASTFEIWGALLNGLELYLVSADTILEPGRLKDAVIKHKITIMWLTSPLFNQLSHNNIDVFAGLGNLLVGGDVLSPAHIDRVRRRFPRLNIINGYGPTENTTFSTTYLIKKEYRENIPIGKPIANSTAYIVDRYCRLVPVGVVGELVVGGDGAARGYLNNPELTGKKFLPDKKFLEVQKPFFKKVFGRRRHMLYKTGDLARWLPDGNIQFLGRMDHQVKIRGYRIESGEIENRLSNYKNIKEAAVLAAQDGAGDKYLCAYIVSDNGGELDIPRLKNYLARDLPDYMIPSSFIPIEKMPLTPRGKVDRKAFTTLKSLHRDALSTHTYAAPGTSLEKNIVQTWKEVLGLDKVGIDDNFFDLGGNSLKVVRAVSQLKESLNRDIPVITLFEYPTVRSLANRLNLETPEETEEEMDRADIKAKGRERLNQKRRLRRGFYE